MKRYLFNFAIIFAVVLGMLTTACNSTATIQKAQDFSEQLRAINKKLAKANNDASDAHKIPLPLHAAVGDAIEGFSKALDSVDAGIDAAKVIVSKKDATKDDLQAKLDFVQRLFDTDVFTAFSKIPEALGVNIPPDVKAQIDDILSSAQLIFAAVRALFADAQTALKETHSV